MGRPDPTGVGGLTGPKATGGAAPSLANLTP